MEGVGSRLSRTSSRYSGPAAAAVFTGRVRKWKKRWVHVSTSSTAGSRASKSNGRGNATPSSNLFLCRWTPLSPASSAAAETEEPPRRRFRYTPIAMLELREKVVSKKQETAEAQEEETDEFIAESPSPPTKNVVLNMNLMMMDTDQTEEPKTGHLDLGVCLKDLNDEDGSVE